MGSYILLLQDNVRSQMAEWAINNVHTAGVELICLGF